ncbi:MAG: hypothetical protein U0270_45585 [Labilithrix sp.]
MSRTLLDRLALLAREAGSALVPDAALPDLSATAALAAGTNAELTLECHLGSTSGRVDLVLGFTPADRDLLMASDARLPPAVRHFFGRWAEPNDTLALVPYVELEIDLDPSRRTPPSTWIGPTIEPRRKGNLSQLVGDRAGLSRVEWPSYRIAMAVGAESGLATEPWRRRLDRVFQALPVSGSIHHFAAFDSRARGAAGARLIVSLPRHDVARYLGEIGSLAPIASVMELLDEVVPFEGQIDLDVDLGLVEAGTKTATYVGMVAPRRVSSRYQATMETLARWCRVPQAKLDAIDAWVARVEGDPSYELSVKIGFDDAIFAKAYLQSRRAPYSLKGHPWADSAAPTGSDSCLAPPCE